MFKKFTLLLICGIAAFVSTSLHAQDKPNIVLLYIDDWGWNETPVLMDASTVNSRMPVIDMPNLEKMAAEGMIFSNAYGSPQCSPARACIQTGQSNPRNGLTVYLGANEGYYDTRNKVQAMPVVPNVSDRTLEDDAVTIAEALKPLGYVSAHVGKWHMRGDPGNQGYAVHDGPTTNNPGNTIRGKSRIPSDMTDPKKMFSITGKAIDFMEDQVENGNPFFVQISHYAMHRGYECKASTRRKYVDHPLIQAYYEKIGRPADKIHRNRDPAAFLGMANDLDRQIGAVLEKLETLGIEDNTYVVMMGDNGYRHNKIIPGYKQPLHGGKWWLWNGGIRVPMIAKGPGIKPDSTFSGNAANYDFLPTFVDWAGMDPDDLENIDGTSLAGYMAGKEPSESFLNRNLYFHYPHYRGGSMPTSAVISGPHKVIHFYQRPDVSMLFDLSKDPGEVSNIADQKPETHSKLFNEMMNYLHRVEARFPKLNLNYDPQVYRNTGDHQTRLKWGPFKGDRPLADDET